MAFSSCALADLNRKNAGAGEPELVARIGLETGPAVVDAAGEIYGDVTNIAARVQALAEPGAVLTTQRIIILDPVWMRLPSGYRHRCSDRDERGELRPHDIESGAA